MKLGLSYNVFDGEELLLYALMPIRNHVDYITVVWHDKSYYNNNASSELFETLSDLNEKGLIDNLVLYKQNLSISGKENEIASRNLGLSFAKTAGCTHHITADVDEMYVENQFVYAKKIIDDGDHDSSLVCIDNYYKNPCWKIWPDQGHRVSFIHKIDNPYDISAKWPVIEITRRNVMTNNCRIFSKEEFTMHHMTYVRKDISKKLNNSPVSSRYNMNKFLANFNKYKLGDRLCIAPDYINRKTILTENLFNIKDDLWVQHQ